MDKGSKKSKWKDDLLENENETRFDEGLRDLKNSKQPREIKT